MNSTPIKLLTAETREINLETRRQILASKFVPKVFSLQDHLQREIIFDLISIGGTI